MALVAGGLARASVKFTVLWSADAENMLADIWLNAVDRRAVTIAQAVVDTELAADPKSKGTEVTYGLHRLKVAPLIVLFEVHRSHRIVEITAVGSAAV